MYIDIIYIIYIYTHLSFMYQKLSDALSTYHDCPRMSMWMMTMTGGALLLLFGGIAYTLGGLIFTLQRLLLMLGIRDQDRQRDTKKPKARRSNTIYIIYRVSQVFQIVF